MGVCTWGDIQGGFEGGSQTWGGQHMGNVHRRAGVERGGGYKGGWLLDLMVMDI